MSLTRFTRVFVAVLFGTTWASAQEIYVDAVVGNDDNPGTETSPRQTLASVSGFGAQYDVLYLKAGGTYETSGLRVTNAAVVAYGSGAKPIVLGTAEGYGVVSAAGGALIDGIKIMGTDVVGGTAINVSGSGNEVLNCEIDGTGSSIMMGFGIMGTGNYIHHNDVRNLGVSVSGDQMGTSGGAEAYMVMGSDNEIAHNSASNCWSDNSTLGGAEGGCLEIVNGEGDGKPELLKELACRFSRFVIPGSSIRLQILAATPSENALAVHFRVLNADGEVALSHGFARLAPR